MSSPGRILEVRTLSGRPVQAGDMTITPQSQAVLVRLPFGGLVWNRPAAVIVEREGRTTRMSIVDVTRLAQVALAFFSIGLVMMARRQARKKKENPDGGAA